MADDYTPTTEEVREAYSWALPDHEYGKGLFDRWLAAHDAALRAEWEAEQGEAGWAWQWCYVEKWADGTGVYERVTFDTEKKARRYLRDNAEHVAGLNAEATDDDRVVASVEKRRVYEPGDWLPVTNTESEKP